MSTRDVVEFLQFLRSRVRYTSWGDCVADGTASCLVVLVTCLGLLDLGKMVVRLVRYLIGLVL